MKNIRKSLIQKLIIITILFSVVSCASINSLFKGSGKKMDEAELEWSDGEYAIALRAIVAILEKDPNFNRAKLFLSENYESGFTKALERAEKAKELTELEMFPLQYKIYLKLSGVQESIKKLELPLTDKKGTFSFEPKEYKDLTKEIDTARRGSVKVKIAEVKSKLETEKTVKSVNYTINNEIFGYYLKNIDKEDKLYKESANTVSNVLSDFAQSYVKSEVMDEVNEGIKAATLALELNPENSKAVNSKKLLEEQVAKVYLAEGLALEKEGTLASLKDAEAKYKKGISIAPDSQVLKKANSNIRVKIANAYILEAKELQAKGDRESLLAAVELLKKAYGDYSESEALLNAGIIAANLVAESYYKEAFDKEKAGGLSIPEIKEVVKIYQKTSDYIPNYKDTQSRISSLLASLSIKVAVVTEGSGEFAKSIGNSFISNLRSSVDKNVNYKDIVDVIENSSSSKFTIKLKVNMSKPIHNEDSKITTKELDYVIHKDGRFEELTSKSDILAANSALGKPTFKEVGKVVYTITTNSLDTYVDYSLKLSITENSSGKEVYNALLANESNAKVKTSNFYKTVTWDKSGAVFDEKGKSYETKNSQLEPAISDSEVQSWVKDKIISNINSSNDEILSTIYNFES